MMDLPVPCVPALQPSLLMPYDNWFREQQRIMKMGGKIIKVKLATGTPGANAGLL